MADLAGFDQVAQGLEGLFQRGGGIVAVVVSQVYAPVVDAVDRLLRACAGDGSLRPGLDPDDVLLLMGFMWRVGADTDGIARADRLMELTITGLRP